MSELKCRVCWRLVLLLQLFIAVSCDTVSIVYNKISVLTLHFVALSNFCIHVAKFVWYMCVRYQCTSTHPGTPS